MADLNPNIILGIQRPRSTSPQDMYAQKAQFDQNELAQRLGNMKMQAFEQERNDANQLRSVYSKFGADTAANTNALYQAGLGKEAGSYAKSQAEAAKLKIDGEKAQIEKALKVFEMSGQIMSGVSDQATWDRARQQTAEVFGPEAAAKMPAQYDPALVDQKRNQALGVKEQLEQKWKAMEYTTPKADALLSAQTSRANNAASNATTMRGQNMTDARSREATSATLTKPFEITGADGKPVLVQQDKQGNIREVTGYTPKQGASKPLTEGQSKALLFGSRMQESGAILDELAGQGTTKSVPGSRTPGIGAAITALGGEKNQKLEQAKRDFINATLRRESGAVIAETEFDNAEKQYFPQIGDTPAVIAQKKRNREVATRGILAEVPDAENRVKNVRGGGATGDFSKPAPNIDALLDKYK